MKMMRKIASGASNWKEGECSGYGFSEQAFALTGFSIGYSYSDPFHGKCIWCVSWSNKPNEPKKLRAIDVTHSKTIHWYRRGMA